MGVPFTIRRGFGHDLVVVLQRVQNMRTSRQNEHIVWTDGVFVLDNVGWESGNSGVKANQERVDYRDEHRIVLCPSELDILLQRVPPEAMFKKK